MASPIYVLYNELAMPVSPYEAIVRPHLRIAQYVQPITTVLDITKRSDPMFLHTMQLHAIHISNFAFSVSLQLL